MTSPKMWMQVNQRSGKKLKTREQEKVGEGEKFHPLCDSWDLCNAL